VPKENGWKGDVVSMKKLILPAVVVFLTDMPDSRFYLATADGKLTCYGKKN
jgi:hypothetical protein